MSGQPQTPTLSRREREIIDAIFAAGGQASAEDVRARLSDPPSYSAVRAMLVRLEAKGAIRHREEGLRYVYSPTTSRVSASRTALNKLVTVFFGGSVSDTAAALLKQDTWTEDDLDALSATIEQVRAERRKR